MLGISRGASIRSKLVGTSLAVSFLLVVICLAGNLVLLRHQARVRAENTLSALLTVVSYEVAAGLDFDSPESVRDGLMGVFRIEDVQFAGITRPDGTEYQTLGGWVAPRVHTPKAPVMEWRDGLLLGHAAIHDNASRAIGTLHIGLSTVRIQAALQRSLLMILGAGLLLVLMAGAVALRTGRALTAPILDLAGAARAMADGRFDRPLRVHNQDEVGLVAEAFNDMAARLEDSHRQIEEQNRELERKVRERTEELRAKNMALAFQNEKVMEVSRLKSAFLANMSHELRTPLNAILALSELLRDGVTGPLANDEQLAQVTMIHESGENLLRLINDVLDLSKIEAGKMEIRHEECDIQEVVRAAVATMQPLAATKDLELTVSCAGEGRGWIDPDRLRQVILNLIGNAVKFTDKGSVQVISRLDESTSTLEVSVRDTGQGIAPEDQERIFQEFRQVDGSATRRHGGTGLGLSICRRLLALMGGEIGVQSRVGHGSTFTFTMPVFSNGHSARVDGLHECADDVGATAWALMPSGAAPGVSIAGVDPGQATAWAGRPPGSSRGKGCILVVDDDESQIASLLRYLSHEGFEVHAAHDGLAAMQELRKLQPDLLVLDLLMPGMSGFEVLERLQADPRRARMPVVVYTAKDLEEQEWRKLQSSVTKILHKGSASVRLLVEDIEQVLQAEVWRRPGSQAEPEDQAA